MLILSFVLLNGLTASHAQNTVQLLQDVSYHIRVSLDDTKHRLKGELQIDFVNASPDTLEELSILLYPNAYSSRQTAFAQQQLLYGNTKFYFAEETEWGSISGLDFTVGGVPVPAVIDPDTPDVATLRLAVAIAPGDRVVLQTPFVVQVPRLFSRLGRAEGGYFITQWHPKLAMFTADGWHAYPYLDYGEFYSPFANYTVEIDLPEAYTVAATGVLTTESEINRLDSLSRAAPTNAQEFTDTAKTRKTLIYQAGDVHDFAWFADKQFHVRTDSVEIDGKVVLCQSFFTPDRPPVWEKATDFLVRSVEFYSEQVGPYPYPQVTAVAGPDFLGGGMEYPMITLIGGLSTEKGLDHIIAHEVGHNWFYGILGSDERRFPWMDEGINTFYEDRYMERYYGERQYNLVFPAMHHKGALSDAQLVIQELYRKNLLGTPVDDPATMRDVPYFINAYFKPALALHMLADLMGAEAFDRAMREYYETWKFSHPGPGDLKAILQDHCRCDLNWLFDDLLTQGELPDYRLENYDPESGQVRIENRNNTITPVEIIGYRNDSIAQSRWVPAQSPLDIIEFQCEGCHKIELFGRGYSLDANYQDNTGMIKGNGISRSKIKFGLPGKVVVPGVSRIGVFPAAGWNSYDGFMLGGYFSNLVWPVRQLQWTLIPMYAFSTKTLTGIGDLMYRGFLEGGVINYWEGRLNVKSFHYNEDEHYGFTDRYARIAPSVLLNFGDHQPNRGFSHTIGFRYTHVAQSYGRGVDFENKIWERESRNYYVNEIQYQLVNRNVLTPYSVKLNLGQGKGFVRLSADYDLKVLYNAKKKAFHFHAFGGWLPVYDSPDANVNLYYNGITSTGFFATDYTYDELLFARNDDTGVFSQQTFVKDAQLKTLYSGGVSSDWMASAGVAADLPIPVPLRAYFDLAISPDLSDGGTRLDYSGGIAVVIADGIFEIYVPLVESVDIRESITYQNRPGFFQRVTFLADLNKLNIARIQDRYLE